MFTGIIEEVGAIRTIQKFGEGKRISIIAKKIVEDIRIGDSISINGVCLTVMEYMKSFFTVEAVEETLSKTTFAQMRQNDPVNLERALKVGDRLGGHFLQGHVDCTGDVSHIEKRKSSWAIHLSFPLEYSKYVIPQGSIAIDGISLTVAEKVSDSKLIISIIPHTFRETIVQYYKPGKQFNIEFDMIGKYVLNLNSMHENPSVLSSDTLSKLGY